MVQQLPSNVHISQHPCLLAKLSQLRSKNTSARDVERLVHEITLIVATEAFATSLSAVSGPEDETPLGFSYPTANIAPDTISLVPILRSGLGMVEGTVTFSPLSPAPSPVPLLILPP